MIEKCIELDEEVVTLLKDYLGNTIEDVILCILGDSRDFQEFHIYFQLAKYLKQFAVVLEIEEEWNQACFYTEFVLFQVLL